jgi:fatty-acyl-CoA synthase
LKQITLGRLLDDAIDRWPDNQAIVYADRDFRMTYRQFGELVERLSRGLMTLGIQKGEKVAVWATNIPYWVALQFATAKIGAVLLTVNTNYRTAELTDLLKQSRAENLFLIDGHQDIDFLQIVYELVPELKTDPRGHLKSDAFPHLKRVFFLGPEKHRGMFSIPEVLALSGVTPRAAFLERQSSLSPFDVVNMQYTSGATGFPKGVMLTHHNIANNGFSVGKNQRLGDTDRICLPVPLFHWFGCVLGVLAAVGHGSGLVILETFDPVQVMAAVEQERCTALYGVPTMFIAVLEHKLFSTFRFDSLRTGIMAGSPCPVPVMRRVMERMRMAQITICYGLTEASPVISQTRADDDLRRRTETVGRPLAGIEVRIVDPETGEPLPAGSQGEVCCRGYNVMKGYYDMPEATAAVIDEDGFLHSGDLGVMDESGYLSITVRRKDMIIRGGENICPRETEGLL